MELALAFGFATISFQGLCGTIGIIVASKVGGIVYDAWRPSAPFFIFGVLNAFCAVFGIRWLLG